MPRKNNKIKPHTTKPYTRVTNKSLNRLDHCVSEDKTNLTNKDRDIYHYEALLAESLTKLILKRAKEKGKSIRILDAGCGSAFCP